jgi:uncharacterized protein YegL
MRKTHVIILLDRSSSMDDKPGKKERTLSDYNEQVDMCKEFNGQDQEVTCSLITYAHDCVEHLWMSKADDLHKSTMEDYITKGNTALQDALMYAYKKIKETIIPDLEEEDAILIQILTDGEENSSRRYVGAGGAAEISKLGKELESTGKVTITFMGADRVVVEGAAKKYNIPVANCAVMSCNSSKSLDYAYSNRSIRNRKYFSARSGPSGSSFRAIPTAMSNLMSDENSVANWTDPDGEANENINRI